MPDQLTEEAWKGCALRAEKALKDARERLQEQTRIDGELESSRMKERTELREEC